MSHTVVREPRAENAPVGATLALPIFAFLSNKWATQASQLQASGSPTIRGIQGPQRQDELFARMNRL